MSTTTLDAIEVGLLVLIGVATLLICFGGIGLAYRTEQQCSAKKAPGADRPSTERVAEEREVARMRSAADRSS